MGSGGVDVYFNDVKVGGTTTLFMHTHTIDSIGGKSGGTYFDWDSSYIRDVRIYRLETSGTELKSELPNLISRLLTTDPEDSTIKSPSEFDYVPVFHQAMDISSDRSYISPSFQGVNLSNFVNWDLQIEYLGTAFAFLQQMAIETAVSTSGYSYCNGVNNRGNKLTPVINRSSEQTVSGVRQVLWSNFQAPSDLWTNNSAYRFGCAKFGYLAGTSNGRSAFSLRIRRTGDTSWITVRSSWAGATSDCDGLAQGLSKNFGVNFDGTAPSSHAIVGSNYNNPN